MRVLKNLTLCVVVLIVSWVQGSLNILPTAAGGIEPTLEVSFVHEADVSGFLWSSDGNRVLTWARDNKLRLWHVQSDLVTEFVHPDIVLGAAWNPEESLIVSWWFGGNIINVWNFSGQLVRSLDHPDRVGGAVWSKDGSKMLSWDFSGHVTMWSSQGERLARINHNSPVVNAMWAFDSTEVISWSENGLMYLWDQTGEIIGVFEHEQLITEVKWNTPQKALLSVSDDHIFLWNRNGEQLAQLSHAEGVRGAEWSEDGQQVLSWSFDHTARIWDINGQEIASLGHDDRVEGAAWSPNHDAILTWAADASARVWTTQGEPVTVLYHGKLDHEGFPVENLNLPFQERVDAAWSQDGSKILSRSNDFELCRGDDCVFSAWLWTKDGRRIAEMPHRRSVQGVRWNATESKILTWSDDGTVKLWDEGGKPLATIQFPGGPVRYADFNHDANRVIVWYVHNIVQIWSIS